MKSKLTYVNLVRYMDGLFESSLQYGDCKKSKNLAIFMVNILEQTVPKFDLEKDSQLHLPRKIYS